MNSNKHKKQIVTSICIATIAAILAVTGKQLYDWRENRVAYAMLEKGYTKYKEKDYINAFNLINKANNTFSSYTNKEGMLNATVYLSMIYYDIGQKDKSYNMLKNINKASLANSKSYCSQQYYRMMAFFSATIDGNWDKAREYTYQSMAFSKKHYPKDTAFIYSDLANMAEIYIKGNKEKEAWMVIGKLNRSKPIANKQYLAQVLYCKGLLLERQSKTDSAYKCYTRALDITRQQKVNDNMHNILSRMAYIDLQRNDTYRYAQHKYELSQFKNKLSDEEMRYRIAVLQNQHLQENKAQEEQKAYILTSMTVILIALTTATIASSTYIIHKSIQTKKRIDELKANSLADHIEQRKMLDELERLKQLS